jgi:hypothetical protein
MKVTHLEDSANALYVIKDGIEFKSRYSDIGIE